MYIHTLRIHSDLRLQEFGVCRLYPAQQPKRVVRVDVVSATDR